MTESQVPESGTGHGMWQDEFFWQIFWDPRVPRRKQKLAEENFHVM